MCSSMFVYSLFVSFICAFCGREQCRKPDVFKLVPDVLSQLHEEEGSHDVSTDKRTTSTRSWMPIDNEPLLQDVYFGMIPPNQTLGSLLEERKSPDDEVSMSVHNHTTTIVPDATQSTSVTQKSIMVKEKGSEHALHDSDKMSFITQVVKDTKISFVNQSNGTKVDLEAPPDLMEDQKKRLQLLVAEFGNRSISSSEEWLSLAVNEGGSAPFGTFDCSFTECYCIRGRYCHWCEGEQMMIPAQLGKMSNLLSEKKVCPTRITSSSTCLVMGCIGEYDNSYTKMVLMYTWSLLIPLLLSLVMLLWTIYRGASDQDGPKEVKFLSFPRTFDDFAQHRFEGASKVGPIKLQTVFDSSCSEHHFPTFVWTTFSGSGKAVAKAAPQLWGTIFVQCLLLLLLRVCALILPWGEYRRVGQPFFAIAELQQTLSMVLPVMMGFYLVNRLQHYWAIRNAGRGVIGKASCVAMTAGAIFTNSSLDADAVMKHKFTLYRLLIVHVFLTFSVVFSSLKDVPRTDLIKAGLLTQKESDFLDTSIVGAPAASTMITERWIVEWIVKNVPESQASWGKKKMMEDAIDLRTASVKLIMDYQERSLYSFEALLFSITKILCMCLAVCIDPAVVDPDKRADIVERMILFRALAKGILVLFYASVLQMLNKLNNPFKTQKQDDDGLDFEAFLFSTEKKLRDYLVGPQWPDPDSESTQS